MQATAAPLLRGAMAARERDPIALMPLLRPVRARARGGAKNREWLAREEDLVWLTNRAVLGLHQLWRGELGRELLAHEPPPVGCPGSRLGRSALERVEKRIRAVPPPWPRPRGRAALQQLTGSGAGVPLAHQSASQPRRAPLRGEIWPADVESVALPEAGSERVPLTLSPRCKALLDNFEEAMLRDGPLEPQEGQVGEAYVDPRLRRPGQLLSLALRMARGGMLRPCAFRRGGVGLFTVVKSASVTTDGLDLKLRLVFDQRFDNLAWREPPWAGLAGPGALSAVDLSGRWGPSSIFEVATGDVPNFYYRLGLPENLVPFFCIPEVTAVQLAEALEAQGESSLAAPFRGGGPFVGLSVPPMGWSWAVYLAQSFLEDMLEAQPPHPPGWDPRSRLVEGAALPPPDPKLDTWHYIYIDDFGSLGVRGPSAPSAALRAKEDGAARLRQVGLSVHKEEFGSNVKVVGVQVGGSPPAVRPSEGRLWLVVAALEELARHEEARPAEVDTITSIAGWMFLVQRPALSVFDHVYAWVREHRKARELVRLGLSVRLELAAAAAVLPLVGQSLVAEWHLRVLMLDASDEGGGVVETTARLEELRAEAKWAHRGGWSVYTGHESWTPNDLAEQEEKDHPVLRAPPGGSCPVFRFLHLYSGHRRRDDLEAWLIRGAASRGWFVEVTCVDLGHGPLFDMTKDENVARLEALLLMGYFDGLHAGTPCSTWSAVRWRPGGPPPLRSWDHPWGLPGLSRAQQATVEAHNALMAATMRLLRAAGRSGATGSKEHPASRRRPPFASIWDTARWRSLARELARDADYCEVTFPQCALGAVSLKPTTLGLLRVAPARFAGLKCEHSEHAPLAGLAEDGTFRTKLAQSYPSEFCRQLAQAHLDAWEGRDPLLPVERAVDLAPRATAPLTVGARVQVPEVARCWDDLSRWRETFRWKWTVPEHNNVLELRAALAGAEALGREPRAWEKRCLIISDSQATIGALAKGRSSRPVFNKLCRRQAALVLGLGMKFYWRYVRTHRNHADGPSRGFPIGVAPSSSPEPVKEDPEEMPGGFRRLAG